jgi:ADP-ribosylation factor-like protein 2
MPLLKIIRKIKRREKEMRLLILGLDNAGKTTILYKFLNLPTDDIPPTVGFNIKTVNYKLISAQGSDEGTKENSYRLNIYDVGGQKSIRSFWRNYFDQSDALIWVVDSADFFRMEDCRKELHSLLKEERLRGASLLVFANKQDLGGVMHVTEISDALGIKELKNGGRHCEVIPCSAWTGDGIDSGFNWLVGNLAKKMYIRD